MHKTDKMHVIFTEFQFTPAPGIVYRTIGGILDIYVFFGPSPELLVQQSTQVRTYMYICHHLNVHIIRDNLLRKLFGKSKKIEKLTQDMNCCLTYIGYRTATDSSLLGIRVSIEPMGLRYH
jgi:hypothetical protein